MVNNFFFLLMRMMPSWQQFLLGLRAVYILVGLEQEMHWRPRSKVAFRTSLNRFGLSGTGSQTVISNEWFKPEANRNKMQSYCAPNSIQRKYCPVGQLACNCEPLLSTPEESALKNCV